MAKTAKSGASSNAGRDGAPVRSAAVKETWIEQASSLVGFFVYLLILKSFFLPLFIIPTGSMAQTLYGQHAIHTCPNCGVEYPVGWQEPANWSGPGAFHPRALQCPNCRFQQFYRPTELMRQGLEPAEILAQPLLPSPGDRIFVHGWVYDQPLASVDGLGPARWDVVVFKVPTDGQTNYIKRLVGLPNEKIEIIGGDLFVNDQIAKKTRDAQHALWFPYYDHDHPPIQPSRLHDYASLRPSRSMRYYPRWVSLDAGAPWLDLAARVVRFDGFASDRAEIQFATDPDAPTEPGLVQDIYSYNEPRPDIQPNPVTDIRLSAEIEGHAAADGYVELSTTKGDRRFFARLNADYSVTVQHQDGPNGERETWADCPPRRTDGAVRLALSHVDGAVRVELDGQVLFETTTQQYEITRSRALQLATSDVRPSIRIAAAKTQATLRHLLIERDVYYTSDVHAVPDGRQRLPYGVQGNPIQLGPHDYFVLGDNSPNSQDARFAFAAPGKNPVGPHLEAAYQRGEFHPGTIPAEQLIGRAFFVYWPGCAPLTPRGPMLLPDLGRARWIR